MYPHEDKWTPHHIGQYRIMLTSSLLPVHSFHLTAIEIKKIGTGEKSDRNTKSAPTSSLETGVVFTRS